MSYQTRFEGVIKKTGGTAYLLREELRIPFLASIQPYRSGADDENLPAGLSAAGHYRLYAAYTSPADSLCFGDRIAYQGQVYFVRWVEARYLRDEAVYVTAVLQNETGEAD